MNHLILQRTLIDAVNVKGFKFVRRTGAKEIIRDIIQDQGKNIHKIPRALIPEYRKQLQNLVDNQDEAIQMVDEFIGSCYSEEELN